MGDQELSVELPPHARLTGLAFDDALPPAIPSLVKFL